MTIDTITLVFLFAILGAMLWDMHRTHTAAQRANIEAHIRTQEILRDIARFLGTDRK
jgi:hypothetical protein